MDIGNPYFNYVTSVFDPKYNTPTSIEIVIIPSRTP